jgi:Leucine-rich repeat (LRR) protein
VPQPPSPHLNLWKKQLGHVPDSVWQQTHLESLVLADNGLAELSGQIGALQNLRTLDLGHNQLTNVPAAIGNLSALTDFLYLHDNQLSSLPTSFAQLIRLRYLNINENRFAQFPESVCSMTSLVELRASHS